MAPCAINIFTLRTVSSWTRGPQKSNITTRAHLDASTLKITMYETCQNVHIHNKSFALFEKCQHGHVYIQKLHCTSSVSLDRCRMKILDSTTGIIVDTGPKKLYSESRFMVDTCTLKICTLRGGSKCTGLHSKVCTVGHALMCTRVQSNL